MDVTEDPEDVYRIWVPARRRVVVSVRGDANVNLELWRATTRSVYEKGSARRRDLFSGSYRTGTKLDSVTVRNRSRRGELVYANVFPGPRVGNADYSLTVATRALR
jgi:hypothetical protein